MKIAVIGAGSWGTAIARLLSAKGLEVSIWARKEEVARGINKRHRNPRYLSNEVLPTSLTSSTSLETCCTDAKAIVVVVPSRLVRTFARNIAPYVSVDTPVIVCSKGVEADTGALSTDILFEELGGDEGRFAALSGPNHAEEVVKGVPAATVIASTSVDTAKFFQDLFNTKTFRPYTSSDVVGVELCGAFKNVIAIACGISFGIGYGDNTAAVLMTRGLAEMSRLVAAVGGDPMTCMGLAGAGDMIVTAGSHLSRNRQFGEAFAHGETLAEYEKRTHMVVEGSVACRTLLPLGVRYHVDLPITQTVHDVIYSGADITNATRALLDRPLKDEF